MPPLRLTSDAQDELRALLNASPADLERACAEEALPGLRADVERLREEIERGRRFTVVALPPAEGDPVRWIEGGVAVLAHLLGAVLPQDAAGSRAVSVWDRDPERTMADGARYHQTHEGGSIHTDNVNQPEIWDYVVFGCVAAAPSGGESIVVDGRQLHADLAARHPDVLATLEADFVWEYRGFKDDVYTAPVITYDERGECRFRYLRPYVEAAHRRVGQPLTRAQVHAFDVLDALLHERERQVRFTLCPGEVLLARDSQILHGRTGFVDHPDAVPAHEAAPGDPLKRTMTRYWVRRTPGADLADRYQRSRLLLSEEMYGPGFQSSGGAQFLERVTPHLALQPGDRVLDLGCGTGGTLRYLVAHHGVEGTGVDGSPDCIAMAREAAARQGVRGLDFVRSDFRTLELSGRYHALWTCQSLLYVSEKVDCLRRVLPHLVPGRSSLIADYCRGEGRASQAFLDYCDDCGFRLPTVQGLADLVGRAGLQVVEAVDYTDGFVDAMAAEVARLEANAADFATRWDADDFEHLRARWNQKIEFCRGGDLRVAYVIARA
ncbi:MAG: TauD/TfdA family dioxygenase [Alphaproteobacteria bacterium]|nr:TauD/TfdA family dioxygenase [Alphaproteobacteria bacterium]